MTIISSRHRSKTLMYSLSLSLLWGKFKLSYSFYRWGNLDTEKLGILCRIRDFFFHERALSCLCLEKFLLWKSTLRRHLTQTINVGRMRLSKLQVSIKCGKVYCSVKWEHKMSLAFSNPVSVFACWFFFSLQNFGLTARMKGCLIV